MPSCCPAERFPQNLRAVPPVWARWFPWLLGPGSPQSVPQKLPWRSPVIFREQKVAKNCPWQSQVPPEWNKCALKLRLAALIAKKELQKLSLAVWSHSGVQKVSLKLPLAVWSHFSECNRVGNSRPWPSQVAPEFYIIFKIVKVDPGSLKIFKDPHWIFEDI